MAKRSSQRGNDQLSETPKGGGPDASSGVDDVIRSLEGTVEALESGELPLEQALERFEEGVRLAKVGNNLLNALEQRVEVLLADRDTPQPFESQSEPHDDRS
ncbi:MAG: exodeoxyribonuclease VII small subunit [Nannocystaceae bacterium]